MIPLLPSRRLSFARIHIHSVLSLATNKYRPSKPALVLVKQSRGWRTAGITNNISLWRLFCRNDHESSRWSERGKIPNGDFKTSRNTAPPYHRSLVNNSASNAANACNSFVACNRQARGPRSRIGPASFVSDAPSSPAEPAVERTATFCVLWPMP